MKAFRRCPGTAAATASPPESCLHLVRGAIKGSTSDDSLSPHTTIVTVIPTATLLQVSSSSSSSLSLSICTLLTKSVWFRGKNGSLLHLQRWHWEAAATSTDRARRIPRRGRLQAAAADGVTTMEEDSGIRLVHALMTCAELVQHGDLHLAGTLVDEMTALLTRINTGCGIGKVAGYFIDALSRRVSGAGSAPASPHETEILYHHFYEASPYLRFAHFTANQAILEAFEGHDCVHVIDFSLMHGLQWPALIQALALRPGGPPILRLTGIGPPSPDGRDTLREIGLRLAELVRSVNVRFAFRGVAASGLEDVKPWMLQVSPNEAVAVNSIMQMHKLLGPDPSRMDVWYIRHSSSIWHLKFLFYPAVFSLLLDLFTFPLPATQPHHQQGSSSLSLPTFTSIDSESTDGPHRGSWESAPSTCVSTGAENVSWPKKAQSVPVASSARILDTANVRGQLSISQSTLSAQFGRATSATPKGSSMSGVDALDSLKSPVMQSITHATIQ
ncbi:hypothetical protein SAY86_032114 [Trapa natans]|uniref:DELLA protein n=1 Tax=Trapa natans TaxID=22666 RepID=A0AAN7R8Z0_TRANT|nr:hypothetical protein SAY86_032114 [Trapa natans]